MSILPSLPTLDTQVPRTVADQIFDMLHERIINLTLQPGVKLSEADVASQLGVSRQPVRDAFYRLSQLGFILIRPQRATTITHISRKAILQAYFIRCALEEATMRSAAGILTEPQIDALYLLLDAQGDAQKADDRARFHTLDDQFHHDICDYAGLGFIWSLIRENKGHMDRARFLSLSFGAPKALADHYDIMSGLRARDGEAAAAAVRIHLSRINDIIDHIQQQRPDVFEPTEN